MFGRAKDWHCLIRASGGRWTAGAVMSLLTTTTDGCINRFGRVYWPLRDRLRAI